MGTLYLVPTPVGNLEDITLRALRILKEADVVLAEDTRTSGILLKHFEIKNQLVSHHKFNEHQTADAFAARMAAGEVMALISDAGTPGISDPGFMLVRACVARGVTVQCLPGPTACHPFGRPAGGAPHHDILRIALPRSKDPHPVRRGVWPRASLLGLS